MSKFNQTFYFFKEGALELSVRGYQRNIFLSQLTKAAKNVSAKSHLIRVDRNSLTDRYDALLFHNWRMRRLQTEKTTKLSVIVDPTNGFSLILLMRSWDVTTKIIKSRLPNNRQVLLWVAGKLNSLFQVSK